MAVQGGVVHAEIRFPGDLVIVCGFNLRKCLRRKVEERVEEVEGVAASAGPSRCCAVYRSSSTPPVFFSNPAASDRTAVPRLLGPAEPPLFARGRAGGVGVSGGGLPHSVWVDMVAPFLAFLPSGVICSRASRLSRERDLSLRSLLSPLALLISASSSSLAGTA